MSATIALTSYTDLPDLISISTHTDHHPGMLRYDSNCTSRTNWFYLASTPCLVFEPELLNAFRSIEAILTAMFEEESL